MFESTPTPLEFSSNEVCAFKSANDDFEYEAVNGSDEGAKLYEFPPLGDFPLEARDEVLDILKPKKRPHSPEEGAASKKPAAIAEASSGIVVEEIEEAPVDFAPAGLKVDTPIAGMHARQPLVSSLVFMGAAGEKQQQALTLKTEPAADDVIEHQAMRVATKLTPQKKPAEQFVERWTCDVCKSCSFKTFEEATSHETECRIKQNETIKEAAGALTSFAMSVTTSISTESVTTEEEEDEMLPSRDPPIDLVPKNNDTSILSDYNNLLVRNIEFFYPAKSHVNYDNLSGSKNATNMTDIRLGLRCLHCKMNPTHITAAAFFPSTTGSIASGLGTIGSRHFGWGKCPNADAELVHQMIESKKNSSLQTRTSGKIGLDAYCKNLASEYGIFDDEVSGICWVEGKRSNTSLSEVNRSSIASVLAGMKHDTNIEMRPFVPSEMNCFWECSRCKSVPVQFRSRGSVVFSVEEPTAEMIEDHVKICNGSQPLAVPRNATIEPFYGDFEEQSLPPIRVSWSSNQSNANTNARATSRRKSEEDSNIQHGVDQDPLCFDADKPFTTDFAYFTVMQLKRCFLTKPGGSRGALPLGCAGLACSHCAGTSTERRFFYTTADHLRNSFSHIPSHLTECSACPDQVKVRLEELKKVRNRQKSCLKPGHHKRFIDTVWDRMHNGPSTDAVNGTEQSNTKTSGASERTTAFSAAVLSRNGSTETILALPTSLVQDEDRDLTSDLAFFTLLQVAPYRMLGGSNSISDDQESREIGFPGLVCSHCVNTPNGRKFFTTSSEHLSELLVTISNHMQTCQSCPKGVRNQITRYRATHESQVQLVTLDDHNRCMKRVWKRLVKASQDEETKPRQAKNVEESIHYLPVDPSKPLVEPQDQDLVTPYTFFTMSQVRACNLGPSGNGSRGQFSSGFPGLECIHCANTSNARKFFYRTVDILSGNYAHIPNHLMACTSCPSEVKIALAEKKEEHMKTKNRLDRGSQRKFFNMLWDRLHATKQIQN